MSSRELGTRGAHSHSHQNIHEPTQQRRPVRPRPASASARRRPPRKGGRAARAKKERARAKVLERLCRPKADVDRGVSSMIADCENCTFQPQITRLAEERSKEQREFMDRVPGYIEGFLIKKAKEPTTHLQFAFKPKLNVKSPRNKKSKAENLRQFLRRNDEHARNKKNLQQQFYAPPPGHKPPSKEKRLKKQADFMQRLDSDLRKRDKKKHSEPDLGFDFGKSKPVDAKTAKLNQEEFYSRMAHDIQARKMKIQMAAEQQRFSHQPTMTHKSAAQKKLDKKVVRDTFLLRYQNDLEKRDEKIQILRRAKNDLEMLPFREATQGIYHNSKGVSV